MQNFFFLSVFSLCLCLKRNTSLIKPICLKKKKSIHDFAFNRHKKRVAEHKKPVFTRVVFINRN